jgi:hypothetical protein
MTPSFDYRVRKMKGYKTIRVFLIGVLCGVIITAAVAFGSQFRPTAITGEWRSGNAVAALGPFDKNGHLSWMWDG